MEGTIQIAPSIDDIQVDGNVMKAVVFGREYTYTMEKEYSPKSEYALKKSLFMCFVLFSYDDQIEEALNRVGIKGKLNVIELE